MLHILGTSAGVHQARKQLSPEHPRRLQPAELV
jgi:hypothetical protein